MGGENILPEGMSPRLDTTVLLSFCKMTYWCYNCLRGPMCLNTGAHRISFSSLWQARVRERSDMKHGLQPLRGVWDGLPEGISMLTMLTVHPGDKQALRFTAKAER